VELGGLATQRGDSVTARQHLREAYEIQREVLVPQAAALRSTSEELATLGAAIAP
jgi:hypothetical protein